MSRWTAAVGLLLGAFLVAGCDKDCIERPEDTGPDTSIRGPELVHVPSIEAVEEGTAVDLVVVATDDDGVGEVTAYYRTVGEPIWETLNLASDGDSWSGVVPGGQVVAPGLQYYFRGEDDSDFRAVTYLPAQGQDDPFVQPVDVDGRTLPFFDDFEWADNAISLYDGDWSEASDGFPGYEWALSQARSFSGDWGLRHRRGIEEVAALQDWLISPALDLTTETEIQVTWMEYGIETELADHTLWISTGSPDPADGEFVKVGDLEPPSEETWTRSAVVDLSVWSGARVAYLAWYYDGHYADAWYIDDVSVRALAPDIALVDATWDVVAPGGQTTVHLAFENTTTVGMTALQVTGLVDASLGSFAGVVDAGAVAGLGTAEAELVLTVDATHPDNAYLPFTVEATDGVETWTYDVVLVVGETSTGEVTLTNSGTGLVQVSMGTGDPATPVAEVHIAAEVLAAGTYTWDADVTDLYDMLPPAPGPERWWLRVRGTLAGSVDAFSIAYDGVQHASTDLGSYPADTETLFWLPEPPAPVVTSSTTSPTTLAPDSTATWSITLRNDGAGTVGLTTATVSTTDPDVIVTTPGPFTLASAGWGANTTAQFDVDVQILDTKTDSQPVVLAILVDDEVESFTTQTQAGVPWPVIGVTAVPIDDFTYGDNDGLLDPSERVNLEVQLTNVGGLSTFGVVACTLAQTGGTATATLIDDSALYSPLAASETDSSTDLELLVTAGAVGDDLSFSLTCVDNATTYDTSFDLVIGEATWLLMSPIGDPVGDNLSSYGFDITRVRYRTDGTTLDIWMESAIPYDPSTLFVEAWMESPGSDYQYYQLVSQSGVGTLRGYEFGVFTRLADPPVSYPAANSIMWSIPLAPFGLRANLLDVGFAAGFCGGGDYYCDHYPNAWGDPYNTGMRTYLWLPIEW